MDQPSTPPQLLLKVFSGPHVGAEVALKDGELLIGSSEECDLILTDTLIAPKHLRVQVGGGGAQVEALSGNATIDGKQMNGKAVALAPFQLLTIGGTHLMIGPRGGAWPSPGSVRLPALFDHSAQPPSAANAQEASTDPETPEAPGNTQSTPSPESETNAPDEAAPSSQSPKRLVHLVLAGFGVLLLTVSLLIGSRLQPSTPSVQRATNLELVRERLRKLAFADTLRLEEMDGRVTVRGYVATPSEKRALASILADMGDRVTIRIWSQDRLLADARDLLRALRMPVDISSESHGVLRARGLVPSREIWTSALQQLRVDLPGITRVDDEQVITAAQLLTSATTLLTQDGLFPAVKPEVQEGTLVLRGTIFETERAAWQGFPGRLQESTGFTVSLQDEVRIVAAKPVAPAPPPAPLVVEAIYMDQLSWIVVSGGRRYFIGAQLPGGYVLERFTDDGAVVRKGEEQRILRIGDPL